MSKAGAIQRMNLILLSVISLCLIACIDLQFAVASGEPVHTLPFDVATDGYANLQEGQRLFQLQRYDEASAYLWRAVLLQETAKRKVSSAYYSEHRNRTLFC